MGGAVPATQQSASAALPGEGHFVGRSRELQLLGRLLQRIAAGQGQAVAVVGGAGIGKTRMAQEIAALAQRAGIVVHWGRCLEQAGAPPFWPWRQGVRDALTSLPDSGLQHQDGSALALMSAIVPELASHLCLPAARHAAPDDASQRFALYDAVAGFWRTLARDTPRLLVLDDMHCADPGSLRLLEFLALESATWPLGVVLTCRDDAGAAAEPLRDCLAELARLPHFRRLRLGGLSNDETAAFVMQAGLPAGELAEAIHARTEGHPLYLVETVRLLAQDRCLAAGPAHAAHTGHAAVQALGGVPDGVRDVVARRLSRLAPGTGRVLTIAACIGRHFELGLLLQLDPEGSEAALQQALDEAVAARVVDAIVRSDSYRFVHVLVRDTLYEQIAPARRIKLHRRIGELLEHRAAADGDHRQAQLAYHFQQAGAAGDTTKALTYTCRAARHAAQSLAHEEAAQLYRQALRLLPQRACDRDAQRTDMLLQLGDAELAIGNGRAATLVYGEAAESAARLGMATALARAAIGFEAAGVIAADSGQRAVTLLQQALRAEGLDAALQVRLQASLCRALLYSQRLAEAESAHGRAVAEARALGDPALLSAALAAFASAVYLPALAPRALQGSIAAWQVLAEADRLAEAAPESNAWLLLGLQRAGQTDALQQRLDTMQALAERARSPYHQAIVGCMAAQIRLDQGDFTRAEASAQQAFAAGRRAGAPQAASAFGMQMFCIRREQGRLAEVQPLLQQLLQSQPQDSVWRPGLALLHAELGQTEACRAVFDSLPWQAMKRLEGDARSQTLLAFAAETCSHLEDAARARQLLALLSPLAGCHLVADLAGPHLGSADRTLGRLATLCGEWALAEDHFDAALAEDARSGGRTWLARGRCQFAMLLLQRGGAGDRGRDRERAQALLTAALQDSQTLGMAALQARVQALLAPLQQAAAALPCGLTQREADVLRLAAIGRNNRDIATVLAISPNTVANHMRSILEKTYTANRTEAAAFARQSGLIQG